LWEFDDTLTRVAEARGQEGLLQALKKLSGPEGGTEIGTSLEQLISASATRDILLVTDGKSYALHVHVLAWSERRRKNQENQMLGLMFVLSIPGIRSSGRGGGISHSPFGASCIPLWPKTSRRASLFKWWQRAG
jgi:hypothetical protein